MTVVGHVIKDKGSEVENGEIMKQDRSAGKHVTSGKRERRKTRGWHKTQQTGANGGKVLQKRSDWTNQEQASFRAILCGST